MVEMNIFTVRVRTPNCILGSKHYRTDYHTKEVFWGGVQITLTILQKQHELSPLGRSSTCPKLRVALFSGVYIFVV